MLDVQKGLPASRGPGVRGIRLSAAECRSADTPVGACTWVQASGHCWRSSRKAPWFLLARHDEPPILPVTKRRSRQKKILDWGGICYLEPRPQPLCCGSF
jgi:hypothetical protein